MKREYAAYINTFIEDGGGTPIDMADDDDLNAFFLKVESEIEGSPHAADIREIIDDARKWLASQAEKHTRLLEELKVKIEASRVELKALLETVPVEPQPTDNPEDEAQAETDATDEAQAETDATDEAQAETDATDEAQAEPSDTKNEFSDRISDLLRPAGALSSVFILAKWLFIQ